MDSLAINISTLLVTGAAIPIITIFFNNRSQNKRDILKYENDRKMEFEKREFEDVKNYREYLMKTVEEIYQLLSYFEHAISLTKSVIDSSKKLKPEEFDMKYEKELEKLILLKSIVVARFPDYYDNVIKIEGLHNCYWGYQRSLLLPDVNDNIKNYSSKQEKIIETANKTSKEIDDLMFKLIKYSKKVNEKYLL